jgi:hypothetical protein
VQLNRSFTHKGVESIELCIKQIVPEMKVMYITWGRGILPFSQNVIQRDEMKDITKFTIRLAQTPEKILSTTLTSFQS